MARPGARVTATVIDRDTLSVDGETYRRDHGDEEVLLRPLFSLSGGATALAPTLQCSNCGYRAGYFSWYHRTGYVARYVNFCPGCGYKVMGVVANDGD